MLNDKKVTSGSLNLVLVHTVLCRLSSKDFDQRVFVGREVVESQKGVHEVCVYAVDLFDYCYVAEVSIVCVRPELPSSGIYSTILRIVRVPLRCNSAILLREDVDERSDQWTPPRHFLFTTKLFFFVVKTF